MQGETRSSGDLVGRWGGAPFRDEVTAWVDHVLRARGVVRTGPLRPEKIRFWSGVFVVPLGEGSSGGHPGRPGDRAWLKVGNPGQAFEGRLLEALGRLVPARVLSPWAVDEEHGWWLLPDGGATLDLSGPDAWVSLVGDVADLQRACRPHRDELAAVPSLEVGDVVPWVAATLEQLATLPAQDPQHLRPGPARAAHRRLGLLGERMSVLAQAGPPATLQPNDVHPRNAVGPAAPDGPVRVFDLGDAFWSHPWAVLHASVRMASGVRLTDPWPDTAAADRLVDAYTERWPEVDRRHRADVVEAADRLGAVHRAASWLRLLAPVDRDRLGVPTPRVADWLERALC